MIGIIFYNVVIHKLTSCIKKILFLELFFYFDKTTEFLYQLFFTAYQTKYYIVLAIINSASIKRENR